ncbi:MAG: Uma2 family endonuclease [Thermomicrobiales bacterium]
MTATHLATAEDLLQMGSRAPYELWEGALREVSTPGFRAAVYGARLAIATFSFADAQGLGYVTSARCGYTLSEHPDTVVAPDVGFVRGDRFPDGMPDRGFCPVPPDLAIEVISPTDTKAEMAEKQALYAKAGVPLVWWVDPERKTATVHRLGHAPEVVEAKGVLDGGDVLPGFELALQAIFRD